MKLTASGAGLASRAGRPSRGHPARPRPVLATGTLAPESGTPPQPARCKDILLTGPWGLGLLRSAPAVGALLMFKLPD